MGFLVQERSSQVELLLCRVGEAEGEAVDEMRERGLHGRRMVMIMMGWRLSWVSVCLRGLVLVLRTASLFLTTLTLQAFLLLSVDLEPVLETFVAEAAPLQAGLLPVRTACFSPPTFFMHMSGTDRGSSCGAGSIRCPCIIAVIILLTIPTSSASGRVSL